MTELLSESSATAENESGVTGEVDSELDTPEGAESAPAAAETGKPATRDKVQERFDTLTREKYEALSARDRERYQREALEARLAALEAQAPTETVAPSDKRPTLESCGYDQEAYDRAIDDWYDKKLDARAESALQKRERLAQQEQAGRDWERKQAEFIKTKPEYAQKVIEAGKRGEWASSDAMTEVIQRSDVGPEIAMYLAENAAKSFEIARLPPTMAAMEIGEIAARIRIAKATPPPVSKAPPPVSKVDATDSTAPVRADSSESDALSDAEWSRRRNAQEQARLRKMRAG